MAIHFDLINVWRIQRKDTLNPNAVRDFTYGEGFVGTRAISLYYDALVKLDTFLISFPDLIMYSYRVPGLEHW